jgi:hypothetical protein
MTRLEEENRATTLAVSFLGVFLTKTAALDGAAYVKALRWSADHCGSPSMRAAVLSIAGAVERQLEQGEADNGSTD